MSKISKYLKPFIIPFILAIILLSVQAYGELALPDYMSNIINTGIQQGGIENFVPTVITETEIQKLSLFLNDTEQEKIMQYYDLVTANSQNFDINYPNLVDENVFVINTKDKEIIDSLNDIMLVPITAISLLSYDDLEEMEIDFTKNMPENMDAFEMISQLPKEQLREKAYETIEEIQLINESIAEQVSFQYIRSQYEKIGINVEKIQSNYIYKSGSKMLAISLLIMIVVITETLIAARIAGSIGTKLRREVFEKVVSFSSAEFSTFSTASLITRTTNDIQQIQNLIVILIRIAIYSPILAIGGLTKVFNSQASMTWIIGLAIAIICLIIIFMFVFAVPRFKKMQFLVDKVNLVMRESLTGMLVVRTFGAQQYEEEKFRKANKDLTSNALFVTRLMSAMMPLMMFTMDTISILIIWVGAKHIDLGTLQVGDMMAFIQYSMQIIMSFLMFSMISMLLPRAMVSANRIKEVLEHEPLINDPLPEDEGEFDVSKKGIVEFKDVSFKYPDAEEYILKNISFTANKGETTAFIGSTGSGKSTVINLVPRFFDVTSGSVLVEGIDVRSVTQKALREKIGYVPQKGLLFSGTIESNLKYDAKEITNNEMYKASEIAQATDFINSKTEKYQDPISQGGTNVSGGQKQRLSIARAIAKSPDIFIFDDSFSALDYKTDSELRKAIKENLSEATLLVVAQRIGTIRHAEQIIVLDKGEIIGIGKHNDLLDSCEVYKQIALSQLSEEELYNE